MKVQSLTMERPNADDCLFDGQDILVKYVPADTPERQVLVITFDCVRDRRHEPDIGFGEHFFRGRQVHAVHVIAKADHWFQTGEMAQARQLVRTLASTFDRAYAYGSSMGGFGALQFGGDMGACAAIALSPQYSNDPHQPPYDKRWKKSAQRFATYEARRGKAPFSRRSYIFYDPRDRDWKHAALLSPRLDACLIEVPFSGHPCAHLMADLGLLSSTILAIIDDRFDDREFRRSLRKAKATSSRYLFELAARARSVRLREDLLTRAIALAEDKAAALQQAAECRATVTARQIAEKARLRTWLRHPRKSLRRSLGALRRYFGKR